MVVHCAYAAAGAAAGCAEGVVRALLTIPRAATKSILCRAKLLNVFKTTISLLTVRLSENGARKLQAIQRMIALVLCPYKPKNVQKRLSPMQVQKFASVHALYISNLCHGMDKPVCCMLLQKRVSLVGDVPNVVRVVPPTDVATLVPVVVLGDAGYVASYYTPTTLLTPAHKLVPVSRRMVID